MAVEEEDLVVEQEAVMLEQEDRMVEVLQEELDRLGPEALLTFFANSSGLSPVQPDVLTNLDLAPYNHDEDEDDFLAALH